MKTKVSEVQSNIMNNQILEKVRKNEKKILTKELVRNLIKELYQQDTNPETDRNPSQRAFLKKNKTYKYECIYNIT